MANINVLVTVIMAVVVLAVGIYVSQGVLNATSITNTSQLYTAYSAIGSNFSNVVSMFWIYLLGAIGIGVIGLFAVFGRGQ